MQIAAILGLARLMGALFQKLRLPQVVGEMAAGIMLGPTLLGAVSPEAFGFLFPADSTQYLNALSQLGVVFFLFLVGLELDPKLLMSQGRAAVAIGVSSIVVPFVLGVGLTAWLASETDLFRDADNIHATMLFMGTAISVTAFPVLARILTDTGTQRTRVGTMSIAAAAANDVVAWCILAGVVAFAQAAGLAQGLWTAAYTALFVLTMVLAVRPFLRRLETVHDRSGRPSPGVIALIFFLILVSAITTEMIGIHALFGAFLLGAVMPRGTRFVSTVAEKIEDFTVVLLLPIFFAYAGINTHIELRGAGEFWIYTGAIIAVACLGKIGGAGIAAKMAGLGARESVSVGVLMNTRGLMELVILNVGRELGVIGDEVFAMMVVMALVTTAMTAPLLELVYPRRWRDRQLASTKRPGYSVLIPVSMPRSAVPLAELADLITGKASQDRRVLGLYLRQQNDFELLRSQVDDRPPEEFEPLQILRDEAGKRGLPVEMLSYTTRDPGLEIASVANARGIDMILMGFHKPLLTQSILGGTVHRVMSLAEAHVGVFVDRGFHGVRRVLVPYMGSTHDRLAMDIAGRIGREAQARVTVLHIVDPERRAEKKLATSGTATRLFNDPTQPAPVELKVVEDESPVDAVIREAASHDLLIIGVTEEWGLEGGMFGFRRERIAAESATSMLIVRRGAQQSGPLKSGATGAKSAES